MNDLQDDRNAGGGGGFVAVGIAADQDDEPTAQEIVYAPWADVLLLLSALDHDRRPGVPAEITGRSRLIVTSNTADAYTLTGALRQEAGRVFVLDPQRIAGVTQTWWWNPLRDIRDMADAHHLVQHFSAPTDAGHDRGDPYFTHGAERLLRQLVVAAARGGDRSLRDVRRWLGTRSEEPVGLLRAAGLGEVAAGLQGTLEAPADQRGGLFETALRMLRCLESESVARYVTPPDTWVEPPSGPIEEFDPRRFLVGHHPDVAGAAVRPRHPLPAHPGWRRNRRTGSRGDGRPHPPRRRRRGRSR